MSMSAVKRLRYTGDNSASAALDVNLYAARVAGEVVEFFREARVPMTVAVRAAEMAEDELRDRLAEESLSWSETLAPTHSGDRGRLGGVQ